MYQVIVPEKSLIQKRISLKNEPVYSKKIAKTDSISEFFNLRENSKYNRSEQEVIIVNFEDFLSLNKEHISTELKYYTFDKTYIDKIVGKGVLFIKNLNEYAVIYDKNSGYIGITKVSNINIL